MNAKSKAFVLGVAVGVIAHYAYNNARAGMNGGGA